MRSGHRYGRKPRLRRILRRVISMGILGLLSLVSAQVVANTLNNSSVQASINAKQYKQAKRLSLNFQNVKVRAALQLLAEFAGINLVVSDAVKGSLTLHLKDVPWEQALNIILQARGLGKEKRGSVLLIAPAKEIARQQHQAGSVRQVLIEARIVIMDKNYEHELGVRWGVTQGKHVSGTLAAANALASGTAPSAVPIKQRLNVDLPAAQIGEALMSSSVALALAKLGSGILLDLELSAMESEDQGKVIASPRLLTANQKKAVIEAGEEIPFQQATASGATSVAFKKAVLSLQVTPYITPNNRVRLILQVNQDTRGPKVLAGVPAINTREIKTQVLVNDGQTIVLGGIYQEKDNHTVEYVPFLSAIPIIGYLFRHTLKKKQQQELLIFVTPKIMHDSI